MAGYSLEEFRVVPCHHFLFSALCFAGFATGYIHTRETNLEGRFPYFVCGAILGGIHFILMLQASIFNDQAKNKEKWNQAPKSIGFYRFLILIFTVYCIAGAALTGIHGFCQRGEVHETTNTTTTTTTTTTTSIPASTEESEKEEEEEPCYFYENYEVNLAMAICIMVLHIFSFFHSIFIIIKSGETEQKAKALAVTPAPKPEPKPQPKPAPKTQPTPSHKGDDKPKNPTPNKTEPPKVTTDQTKTSKTTRHKTKSPKVTPAKTKSSKVTPDKTAPKTTVTANIIVNTIGSDMNRTDSYTFQTEEEHALRLLRLHQAQEAVRNTQIGAYSGGFKDDGRPYMPAYPPPPVPPPPSYETVMAGAYPAQDPLQPVVLESDTNHMFLWSPGPELERSKEYNNDISRRSYQLAGVPTSPRLSGEISADIPPPPVLPLNNLNSIYHIDSNV